MKNTYTFLLDSSFRMKSENPTNTKVIFPSNSTSTEMIENVYPLLYFRWMNPDINYIDGLLQGGNTRTLILSTIFKDVIPFKLRQYYTGCYLSLLLNGIELERSKILSYNYEKNTATVEIPFTTLDNIQNIRITYPDSKQNPFFLQILGYNVLQFFEYGDLYIYNYDQHWTRRISNISKTGLINFDIPVPLDKYNYNDLMILKTDPNISIFPFTHFFTNSIYEYNIIQGQYPYKNNMRVYVRENETSIPQIYRILKTQNNQILEMEVIQYGDSFTFLNEYCIIPVEEDYNEDYHEMYALLIPTFITIVVETTNSIPDPNYNKIYFIINNYRFTLLQDPEIYVLDYIVDYNTIVITSARDLQLPYVEFYTENSMNITDYSFLRQKKVPVNLNIPNSSIPQNNICMKISVNSLILPNSFVKGYNVLLSFFPYVILRLYNVDSVMTSKFKRNISNNPYTIDAQFICPIGNLLNPDIIRFVEIKSDMEQIIKFNIYQDIFFEVLLPNGNLLEYNNIELYSRNETIEYLQYSIKNTVACILNMTIL